MNTAIDIALWYAIASAAATLTVAALATARAINRHRARQRDLHRIETYANRSHSHPGQHRKETP